MALPSMVADSLTSLPEKSKAHFYEEYNRNKKSYLLVFPMWLISFHYLYFGKWGTQFLFWFTFGGFLVWYFVDFFRIWGMVSNHNKTAAIEALKNVMALKGEATA